MLLKDRVHIARRFLRSIRIDTDLGDPKSLDGFICPQTSAEVLLTMAKHISETGQGAFTWTGPYGGGKSSLIIALSALLNGNRKLRKYAADVLGEEVTGSVRKALPVRTKGWHIVPVVGRRESPPQVIGESLIATGLARQKPQGGWTEISVIKAITKIMASTSKSHGGLVIFVDEMGKFLESATYESSDIYIFQQLAELASRSNGRLLIVGVLHQAFEEYGSRLSREMRDEWAKIQGRFIDLSVSASGEEQIDLISRAMQSDRKVNKPSKTAQTIASAVRGGQVINADKLPLTLEKCWPLHPVVACLLGSISRRRFGQNQRSIFGFLNSAEPHGFQDFINYATDDQIYTPDKLWDYLRANLEPSILASPDGHRWALASDALERCEFIGGDALHIKLLKTIAVIDLFKERSNLLPTLDLLKTCFPAVADKKLKDALGQLGKWSFTIFKKFLDAHAIYAGSDFDIDQSVKDALEEIDALDFVALKQFAGLQPVLAKRHYHDTGAMRWFDVNICALRDASETAANYEACDGAVGQFLLVIPTEGEDEIVAGSLCDKAADHKGHCDIIVGLSERSWEIVPLARELLALDLVRSNHPKLAGDEVARREVDARIVEITGLLEQELNAAFDKSTWYQKRSKPRAYRHAELNSLASELADKRYNKCPRLHNELLNRQKPSASAISAQKSLLRRMVSNEGEPRLGIDGYPAEGGLFASILEPTNLYSKQDDGTWGFVTPSRGKADKSNLAPIWHAASEFIKREGKTVSIAKLYDEWRKPPYGVKDGLMPTLAVAFILSQRENIAVYRDGVFRAQFNDVDIDYLAKTPTFIQLRWVNLSKVTERLLESMVEIVQDLSPKNSVTALKPIEVARGLVSIYEQLPRWTTRTTRLSEGAIGIRNLFRYANDPNKFLLDDLPKLLGVSDLSNDEDFHGIAVKVRDGLSELAQAYVGMLHHLRDAMLAELQVLDNKPESLALLRERAENIRQISGEFNLDAFVGRLSQFNGSDESFEEIVSLAAGKPPREWVDPDLDRGAINLVDLAQKFLRTESFARVKGRRDKRQSIAVVIGMKDNRPAPILEEFQVADSDRDEIEGIITRVEDALKHADTDQHNLILAALAEVSARYMTVQSQVKPDHKMESRAAKWMDMTVQSRVKPDHKKKAVSR